MLEILFSVWTNSLTIKSNLQSTEDMIERQVVPWYVKRKRM